MDKVFIAPQVNFEPCGPEYTAQLNLILTKRQVDDLISTFKCAFDSPRPSGRVGIGLSGNFVTKRLDGSGLYDVIKDSISLAP